MVLGIKAGYDGDSLSYLDMMERSKVTKVMFQVGRDLLCTDYFLLLFVRFRLICGRLAAIAPRSTCFTKILPFLRMSTENNTLKCDEFDKEDEERRHREKLVMDEGRYR